MKFSVNITIIFVACFSVSSFADYVQRYQVEIDYNMPNQVNDAPPSSRSDNNQKLTTREREVREQKQTVEDARQRNSHLKSIVETRASEIARDLVKDWRAKKELDVEPQKPSFRDFHGYKITTNNLGAVAKGISELEESLSLSNNVETREFLSQNEIPRMLRAQEHVQLHKLPTFKTPELQAQQILIRNMVGVLGIISPDGLKLRGFAWLKASMFLLHSAKYLEDAGQIKLAEEALNKSRAIVNFLSGEGDRFGLAITGQTPDTLSIVYDPNELTIHAFQKTSPENVYLAAVNSLFNSIKQSQLIQDPMQIGVVVLHIFSTNQIPKLGLTAMESAAKQLYDSQTPVEREMFRHYMRGAIDFLSLGQPIPQRGINIWTAVSGKNLLGDDVSTEEINKARFSVIKDLRVKGDNPGEFNADNINKFFKYNPQFGLDKLMVDKGQLPVTQLRTMDWQGRAKELTLDAEVIGLHSSLTINDYEKGSGKVYSYMLNWGSNEPVLVHFRSKDGNDRYPYRDFHMLTREVEGMTKDQIANRYKISKDMLDYVDVPKLKRGDIVRIDSEKGFFARIVPQNGQKNESYIYQVETDSNGRLIFNSLREKFKK